MVAKIKRQRLLQTNNAEEVQLQNSETIGGQHSKNPNFQIHTGRTDQNKKRSQSQVDITTGKLNWTQATNKKKFELPPTLL